jgi:cell division transport system ATP-binding protein
VGRALDGVTFKVRKGEFVFLTGHSGAGKTSLLRMVHVADLPTEGEVRVNGYDTRRLRSREIAMLRRKIGSSSRTSACCRTGRLPRTWRSRWR